MLFLVLHMLSQIGPNVPNLTHTVVLQVAVDIIPIALSTINEQQTMIGECLQAH